MRTRSFLAAILASSFTVTSVAIEFGGDNDVTQTAGTVAPDNFGDTNQWMQTASSSNNVPMMTPSGVGSQGWTTPTVTDSPSMFSSTGSQGWTPPSGTGDQGWAPSSGTGDQGWTPSSDSSGGASPPGTEYGSLECSGSDEGPTDNYGSLECSGSDEEEIPSTTGSSDTPMVTAAPSTDQNSPPTTASSSSTLTSTASSEYESSTPTTSSLSSEATTNSDVGNEEDSSQTSQISPASSSNTPSTTVESSGTGQQEQQPAGETSSNTTSRIHATFGTVTSKAGECIVGDPDMYISPKDLDWIWNNRMKAEVEPYNNWIMDHIVANKGTLNYCVRWESSTTVLTKEIAKKLQPMLTRQHAAWNRWLIGYDCWPYDEIKINIVGFAAKKASDLGWSDNSMGKLYIGDLDKDGAPQCPENCYRSVDGSPGGYSESSGCDGKPFDVSLWPKQDLGGGWGTYWGQQVNLDNMLEHLDDDELEIVSHEMGHGFGLPDFYQEPKPDNFPPTLMDAFTSASVRDSDGWMLRRVLESKKANYKF
ncbi:hypothetical protein P3T76_007678 [Phytophthora citrophthora]|uniref:Neutral zinc metallopeptidase, Zn-binding site n=1 Tax=Phytophthora citrophthora TaxID=4793 RepID=A0AAD9LML8_9STRA|nr:hypothetical protein P3T76_007678 [Phytophthora citrophthora]